MAFKVKRAARIARLQSLGFLYHEAVDLTKRRTVKATGRKYPSPITFHKGSKALKGVLAMIKHRAEIVADARRRGDSVKGAINKDYADHGWDNPWDMARDFIEDYSPPGKGKPREIDEGQVTRQRTRERERRIQRTTGGERPSSNPQDWLEQKQQAIAREPDPRRRAQLEREAENLRRMINDARNRRSNR